MSEIRFAFLKQIFRASLLAFALAAPSFWFVQAHGQTDYRKGWELVLKEDFQRSELGGSWSVEDGSWVLTNSTLEGHGTLMTSRGHPDDSYGYTRFEFEVELTRENMSGPFGVFLHGRPPGKVDKPSWKTGYFFGFAETEGRRFIIYRDGREVASSSPEKEIVIPGRIYKIVVENDERNLRILVDGKRMAEWHDPSSFMANTDYNRVGFHFPSPVKIRHVQIFIKRVDDMDNFL